jgi:hypothetical protein
MKTETDIFINQIIQRIISGVADQIQKEFTPPVCDKDNEVKLSSITDFSRKYGISKPVVYRLINNGTLPCYQISGSSKKYLKPEDIELVLEQVPVPPKVEEYESFERELRLSIKRGRKLATLIDDFLKTDNKKSVSGFSLYCWQAGCRKEIFKGIIPLDLESIFKSNNH